MKITLPSISLKFTKREYTITEATTFLYFNQENSIIQENMQEMLKKADNSPETTIAGIPTDVRLLLFSFRVSGQWSTLYSILPSFDINPRVIQLTILTLSMS
jgi:hypothetical protein